MQELTEPQKAWIAALRSGKYEQGANNLSRGGKFCCLGVACDLFKEELQIVVGSFEVVNIGFVTTYDGHRGGVPEKVQEHLGLYDFCGNSRHSGESLVAMNDQGIPFAKIAEAIEANPENYFKPVEV